MRAAEAPARDAQLAQSPHARHGAALFDKVGCDICHVQTLTTAPVGTNINVGTYAIFFFNDTATTEIYTLSLHDALPIWIDPEDRNPRGPFDDRGLHQP